MEILVYQSFITFEDEKQLTPDELFVYGHIRKRMSLEYRVETSIDVLSKRIEFLKTPKRNKARIRQILQSLNDKGVINFIEEDGIIDIEVIYFEENFDMIPMNVFEGSTPEEFMVMCFIYRHQKYNEVCSLTYEYAGKLLGISTRTAFSVIEELVNVGKLYKIQGAKKAGTQERFPNKYFLTFVGKSPTNIEKFIVDPEEANKVDEKTEKKIKQKAQERTEKLVGNELVLDNLTKRFGGD